MRFDVLTIFPEMFTAYLTEGVLGQAVKKGKISVKLNNIRNFTSDPHRTTDDRPYGGGNGMVMKPEPLFRALKSVERVDKSAEAVLLTPQGTPFDRATAWRLSRKRQLILICGRYEGVDERIRQLCIDREISIGDYVLSGGELAALVVMDAVSRLIPGVLGGAKSNREDSFEEGLLEYPQYTRPACFQNLDVPPVLISGNHEKIRLWRRREALKRTMEKRPDLLRKAKLTPEDREFLASLHQDRDGK